MSATQADRPLPSPNEPNSPSLSASPQQSHLCLSAYKQLSLLFKNNTGNSRAYLQAQAEQQLKSLHHLPGEAALDVKNITQALIASKSSQQITVSYRSQEESAIAAFWVSSMSVEPSNNWSHSDPLSVGSSLWGQKIGLESQSALSMSKCKPFVAYNTAVCLYKLGMLQEALKMTEIAMEASQQLVTVWAKRLRLCILVRMGVSRTNVQDSDGADGQMKYLQDSLLIGSMSKTGLAAWMQKCRKEGSKLHIGNWYNLALTCRNKCLHQECINILEHLLLIKPQLDNHLVNKCYVLMAEAFQGQNCYQQALGALMKLENEASPELEMKMWCLRKKIRIEKADKAKIQKALLIDPRFSQLNHLQAELKKLTKNQSHNNVRDITTITIKKKTKGMQIVFKTAKKTKHISTQSTTLQEKEKNELRQQKPRMSTLRLSHNKIKLAKKCSLVHSKSKELSIFNFPTNATPLKPQTPRASLTIKPSLKSTQFQSALYSPAETPRQLADCKPSTGRTKEKEVRFDLSDSSSESASGLTLSSLINTLEERIVEHIFQENFQEAMDEIKNAEDRLEQLQGESKERAVGFTLKLSKWCRQSGKERYATLLLKRVLLRYEPGDYRVSLLRELGRHYEQLKEYKSAIEVNLELVKLGQTQCLDKLGEMHMLRENYSQALKYYERYHEMRDDTYSLVKLAHAYSKIPSYSKRAVDLLNDLLFLNKTSCIFRPHPTHQTDDFQSALLLLVTIYMNLKGHKKAADICEKYLNEVFGAYPIYYILGILRLREERKEEAFTCFLSAVRLKPNHLPSLLELLRFLTSRSSEVLAVLRKAFHAHHRDWDLLQMLVEAATKSPSRHASISIPALIDCARALEGAGLQGLQLQVQAVWMWAAELIDDRQRRMSIVDQQFFENVYVRLGEIALKKGNYMLSERYFSKVLQKLQLERSRVKAKSRVHYIKLEIEILRRMAYLKSQRREPEIALSYLEQSKRVAADHDLPLEAICDSQKIGQLHFVMENYHQAVREFSSCCRQLEGQPEGVDGHWEKWKDLQLEIGNCHQNMREWREARRTFQGILSHRLCEEAIRNLANLYAWQGSPQMAKELLQGLRVIRPTPQFE